MPLPSKVADQLRRVLPKLKPQPQTAQMPDTMEFDEAEQELGLRVTDFFEAFRNVWKVTIFRAGGGSYHATVWANEGRPYIRILVGSDLVDVFLLPPQ